VVALALTPNRMTGGQCSSRDIRTSECVPPQAFAPARAFAGHFQRQENNRLVF